MKVVTLLSRNGNGNEGANNHSKNIYKNVKRLPYPSIKFTKCHFHELLTELISESSLSK